MAQTKQRLDLVLVDRGLAPTRAKARGMILAGEVLVDGERVDKAGTAVWPQAQITLKDTLPYVGRGGLKLAAALEAFGIEVNGRLCADVGACTGGFTDVLRQGGAARVYAIDVGYGQLDWKLRQDARVVVMERTNARYLEALAERVSFVCIDVSFISLTLILPAVRQWLDRSRTADVVALIKPQFEAGPQQVGKGGIVKETAVHRQVLRSLLAWCGSHGWTWRGLIPSPVTGAGGNVEFLVWLRPGDAAAAGDEMIEAALAELAEAA